MGFGVQGWDPKPHTMLCTRIRSLHVLVANIVHTELVSKYVLHGHVDTLVDASSGGPR